MNNLGVDNSQALSWTKSFEYNNLSISDSNESQLFVYPNPFTKYLYISLTNGQQIEKLNVYSLEGRLISSFNSSKNRDVFVMNNLSQGTYLVEVVSGSKSYIKQLIRK